MKPGRGAAIAVVLAVVLAGALWWAAPFRQAAPPVAPEKLAIAVSGTYIGSGLVQVAAARGYFAQEGLEVTLQQHTSGRDALDAVLGNHADIATAGDTPLMFAVMKGAPISVVATIFTAGRAHGIVARRDRGIATPADLAGKRLGATFGTDAHFVADVMLAEQGKSLSSVHLENLKPEDAPAALSSGRVDAVATWEPWIGKARKAVGDNAIAFLTDPGFLIGFNLAGRKDWVGANQEKVRRLLRALVRAEQLVVEKPQEARTLILEATGTDRSIFDAGGPSYRFQVRLDQSLLIMLEDQGRWAINEGLTERRQVPNLLDALDLRPLEAVRPGAISIVR